MAKRSIFQRRGYKKNLVYVFDTNSRKIIFILLAQVVALYIYLTLVNVRYSDFKNLFLNSVIDQSIIILSPKNSSNDLPKIIYDIF